MKVSGDLLSVFIEEVCDGLDLDSCALGSTTWKRHEVERGIEADLCYCFDPAKVAACRAAVAHNANDNAVYPSCRIWRPKSTSHLQD